MPDLLKMWADYLVSNDCAPATVRIRLTTIRGLARHAGVADPRGLTAADVASFLAVPRARWTRVTYWVGIKQFSAWLRESGHDPNSYLTRGIKRPRTPDQVARPIDDLTIRRLLTAKLTPRTHAYVRLALFQGLRVHEIAKVRGEDFSDGWLTVLGKGGHEAQIPVHAEVASVSATMPEFGYWFPGSCDGHVHPTSVSHTIHNALRSIGSGAVPHQLRDTCATRVQRQGKDIRVTQAMLRHRSLRSTQKYVAVNDEDLRAAVAALDWAA